MRPGLLISGGGRHQGQRNREKRETRSAKALLHPLYEEATLAPGAFDVGKSGVGKSGRRQRAPSLLHPRTRQRHGRGDRYEPEVPHLEPTLIDLATRAVALEGHVADSRARAARKGAQVKSRDVVYEQGAQVVGEDSTAQAAWSSGTSCLISLLV